jgi:hypothetical protein
MLVDRGPMGAGADPCKFAQKVWNAQRAGARGVVVVNYEDALTTMEAPDDDDEVNYRYLRNITGEPPTPPLALVLHITGGGGWGRGWREGRWRVCLRGAGCRRVRVEAAEGMAG